MTDKKNELDYLFERTSIIIDFLINYFGDKSILNFKEILSKTYKTERVVSMKMLSSDMNSWAKHLPLPEKIKLQKLLKERFDEEPSIDKFVLKTIKKILKRGRINNDIEFRIIKEYVIEIDSCDFFFDKHDEFNLLLTKY